MTLQARVEARIDRVEVRLDTRIEQRATEIRADQKVSLTATERRLVGWLLRFVATAVLTILGLG